MFRLDSPADGLVSFELSPLVFRSIAAWAKEQGVRIVNRKVVRGPYPIVLVAYSLE